MAQRADKPPILRVLLLLVALVGVALTLAALSPQAPDNAMSSAGTQQSAPATPAPGSRP